MFPTVRPTRFFLNVAARAACHVCTNARIAALAMHAVDGDE
jgi:hypothetical protein